MKNAAHTVVLGSLAILVSVSALADHNSPHGSGWANMPNDIHNTRIEDGLGGTEFRDFVRQGAGADTVNRYLESGATLRGAGRSAAGGGNRRR